MFNDSHEINERLQNLHKAFLASLFDRVRAIEALWHIVKCQDTGTSPEATELYRAVHSLAGSAGTFGQKYTGDIAHQLECTLQQCLNSPLAIDAASRELIERELQILKQSVTHS
ncbi:MAG: Hpt domain-containing protein [Methylococcaceae bacterium]